MPKPSSGKKRNDFRSEVIRAVKNNEGLVWVGPDGHKSDVVKKEDIDARFNMPDDGKYAGIISEINALKVPNTINQKTYPEKVFDYFEKYTDKITKGLSSEELFGLADSLGIKYQIARSSKKFPYVKLQHYNHKISTGEQNIKVPIMRAIRSNFVNGMGYLARRSLGSPTYNFEQKIQGWVKDSKKGKYKLGISVEK